MYAPAHALETGDDRRTDLRSFIDLQPVLMESRAVSEQVQIVNVARRGFLARALFHYPTGDRVRLHIGGGDPVEARIVWSAKNMIGGRFDEGFDMQRMETLDPHSTPFAGRDRPEPLAGEERGADA